MGKPIAAVLLVTHDLAAKLHDDGGFLLARLPGIAAGEPIVHSLDLTTVHDLLSEEAVSVTHAVAMSVDSQRCHGVHETRSKPSETTVAKPGVTLLGLHGIQGGAQPLAALLHDIAAAKVEQVVVKQRSKEKLDGEVVNLLLVRDVHCGLDVA